MVSLGSPDSIWFGGGIAERSSWRNCSFGWRMMAVKCRQPTSVAPSGVPVMGGWLKYHSPSNVLCCAVCCAHKRCSDCGPNCVPPKMAKVPALFPRDGSASCKEILTTLSRYKNKILVESFFSETRRGRGNVNWCSRALFSIPTFLIVSSWCGNYSRKALDQNFVLSYHIGNMHSYISSCHTHAKKVRELSPKWPQWTV